MIKIYVSIRNTKTCRSWVKRIREVDLTQKGGWAIQGEFLSSTDGYLDGHYGNLYEDDTASPGTFYLVAYQGGSWKNQEKWSALVRVTEDGATDYKKGRYYGSLSVEGGEIVFLASDYAQQDAIDQLRGLGVVFDNETRSKAKNPIYACALAYTRLETNTTLPPLPEGWSWGPEVSGIRFLRREGHAELVFPTHPFLPAEFLRSQAERLRSLARVCDTAAEMSEKADEVGVGVGGNDQEHQD